MRAIIVKCVERLTVYSVNGPITIVRLVPAGPLNSNTGMMEIHVHDVEDHAEYQVGREFRLAPEAL